MKEYKPIEAMNTAQMQIRQGSKIENPIQMAISKDGRSDGNKCPK
jgi:hypothetical protein